MRADTSNKRMQFFGPDSAAPAIVSNDPPNGQSDISVTPCACATFNEVMATSTINANTVTLKDSGNSPVAGLVSFDPAKKVASFTPSAPLQYSTSYTVTIKGGPSGVKDTAGNPLAADFSWALLQWHNQLEEFIRLPENGALTALVADSLGYPLE